MRWHFPLLIVCLAIAPLTAADPARVVTRGQPSCDAVPPSCEAPEPNCAARPPCKPPCNPPPQQQAPLYVQQPGVFVQPPASGTVQGPVEQSGIEGATITFPELSLRMPSIRFPGRSRTRQNARMIMDQQVAPYMEGPVTQAAPMAAPAAAPLAAAPLAAAPQMMLAPQMMAAPQMMMAPVQMAPQYYMPQQAPVQFAPPPAAQPPMQVPQPERDVQPCDPRPSCDARGNPLAMSAEQEMRALEFAEQRLKQRLDVLRQQVEQLEMTQRPPTPAPDLGARAVQLPTAQPLRPVGNQQTQPVSQPVSQPVRPIGQPLTNTQPSYNERPVAYITEPQRLPQYPQQPQYAPQYQPQQMQVPQSQVIREPQAPTAAVTGLRVR